MGKKNSCKPIMAFSNAVPRFTNKIKHNLSFVVKGVKTYTYKTPI